MGTLFYGAGRLAITFDDRVLAHLQLAVSTKLRRQETFMLNWRDNESVGDGRSAVWIGPQTDLHFKYSGSRLPEINPEWVSALVVSASTPLGLQLLDEGSLDVPPSTRNGSRRTGSAR
ncbi:ATP-dependent DNA ligase [Leifsonia sp. SIMBA_070]|uniref:DUF7882 family protein n=1 Tax=Leifsonia sp. SIMBA_070 TaxID=3085810 RepID=UPI00397E5417